MKLVIAFEGEEFTARIKTGLALSTFAKVCIFVVLNVWRRCVCVCVSVCLCVYLRLLCASSMCVLCVCVCRAESV